MFLQKYFIYSNHTVELDFGKEETKYLFEDLMKKWKKITSMFLFNYLCIAYFLNIKRI